MVELLPFIDSDIDLLSPLTKHSLNLQAQEILK